MTKAKTLCCYYSFKPDGKTCNWCGQESEPITLANKPELIKDLDALLCDWDKPSTLATYDLDATISKVYTFIKKKGLK